MSLFCNSYISASFLAVGALYAIFEPLVEQTGLSYAQLNEGTGYTYLFFGIGPLLFQSLSVLIGKRPVYLISLVGQGACMVWAAWTKGNAQWVINRILLGFFASPSFTLCAVSIADLYFFHERGFYMSGEWGNEDEVKVINAHVSGMFNSISLHAVDLPSTVIGADHWFWNLFSTGIQSGASE